MAHEKTLACQPWTVSPIPQNGFCECWELIPALKSVLLQWSLNDALIEIKVRNSQNESVISLKNLKTSLTCSYRKINDLHAKKFEIELSFKQLVLDPWSSYDLLYRMKFGDEKGTALGHCTFKPPSKRQIFFFLRHHKSHGEGYKTWCNVTPEF